MNEYYLLEIAGFAANTQRDQRSVADNTAVLSRERGGPWKGNVRGTCAELCHDKELVACEMSSQEEAMVSTFSRRATLSCKQCLKVVPQGFKNLATAQNLM